MADTASSDDGMGLDDEENSPDMDSGERPPLGKGESTVSIGTRITEGHKNHNLVYIMILGIRTVVSQANCTMLPPNRFPVEVDSQQVRKMKFISDGSEVTPAHNHADFKFHDYAPLTFRFLRKIYFSGDESDYLLSLTKEYVLSEMTSPGKSGQFFYFSNDLRFVIKTISHTEAKLLLKILFRYYQHMRDNPNTLLSKFCGLHRLKPHKGKKTYFVIMQNVFPPGLDIHRRFDLKGSTQGRTVGPDKIEKEGVTLKDLDFLTLKGKIKLGPTKAKIFLDQVKKDSEFLKMIKVMDYSLLLGVHDLSVANTRALRQRALTMVQPFEPEYKDRAAIKAANLSRKARRKAKKRLVKRPVQISALKAGDLPEHVTGFQPYKRSAFLADHGGFQSTDLLDQPLNELYFVGIIDFLQSYNLVKAIENRYKGLRYDPETISSVPPSKYCARFQAFLREHTGVLAPGDEGYVPPVRRPALPGSGASDPQEESPEHPDTRHAGGAHLALPQSLRQRGRRENGHVGGDSDPGPAGGDDRRNGPAERRQHTEDGRDASGTRPRGGVGWGSPRDPARVLADHVVELDDHRPRPGAPSGTTARRHTRPAPQRPPRPDEGEFGAGVGDGGYGRDRPHRPSRPDERPPRPPRPDEARGGKPPLYPRDGSRDELDYHDNDPDEYRDDGGHRHYRHRRVHRHHAADHRDPEDDDGHDWDETPPPRGRTGGGRGSGAPERTGKAPAAAAVHDEADGMSGSEDPNFWESNLDSSDSMSSSEWTDFGSGER